MSPENRRISGATGYCLVAPETKQIVFFLEDPDSVTIDLRGMPGSQPVIAVDAKADYHEIYRGMLTPAVHTIDLRRTSDWAIAAGAAAEQRGAGQ